MANEPKKPDLEEDEEEDVPSDEEIEEQKRKIQDWKHPDDGTELSEPDRKF